MQQQAALQSTAQLSGLPSPPVFLHSPPQMRSPDMPGQPLNLTKPKQTGHAPRFDLMVSRHCTLFVVKLLTLL